AVCDHIDIILEELHRAVGEDEVGSPGMLAGKSLGGGAVAAAERGYGILPFAIAVGGARGSRVRVPAQGNRRTRNAAVLAVHVAVGRAVGEHFADDDRVARAVSGAGQRGGGEPVVVEEAAELAGAVEIRGRRSPESAPADDRLARGLLAMGIGLPGK